ncbi:hypothetical protein JYU34_001125, partial [Plutella xylostella]
NQATGPVLMAANPAITDKDLQTPTMIDRTNLTATNQLSKMVDTKTTDQPPH